MLERMRANINGHVLEIFIEFSSIKVTFLMLVLLTSKDYFGYFSVKTQKSKNIMIKLTTTFSISYQGLHK